MRRILITNDDGIAAPGLARLAAAAQKYGEVWVVAPDAQRSADMRQKQMSITGQEILTKDKVNIRMNFRSRASMLFHAAARRLTASASAV